MAFQMRGGAYKWTPIMHEIRGLVKNQRQIKYHDFILVPLVKYIIEVLEVHKNRKTCNSTDSCVQ